MLVKLEKLDQKCQYSTLMDQSVPLITVMSIVQPRRIHFCLNLRNLQELLNFWTSRTFWKLQVWLDVIRKSKEALIQTSVFRVNDINFFIVQVNLCQKHSFSNQLTHNMTTDCSLIPDFSTRKIQLQNMLCINIGFCFGLQNNVCTQHVLNLYFSCTEFRNDSRISASEKDLPVRQMENKDPEALT